MPQALHHIAGKCTGGERAALMAAPVIESDISLIGTPQHDAAVTQENELHLSGLQLIGSSKPGDDFALYMALKEDHHGAAWYDWEPGLVRRDPKTLSAWKEKLADGTLAVSELELTEPGLYLEELPENGPAFAALVSRLLAT